MYMPAFKAKTLVKGVSDETELSDLQGTLAGRSREMRNRESCISRAPSHTSKCTPARTFLAPWSSFGTTAKQVLLNSLGNS
jgi:hypothetical protein